MKPFLSVYGHVSVDQIMSVTDFPKTNTSVDIIEKSTNLGGTGTNIAVTAASLGVPTAICSFVGNDFPENFENFMRSKGLIMDEFVKVEGFDTSQALIVNDSNMDQKVMFYQGPQGAASKLDNILTKNARMSSFVHFCTGEPEYYISVMNEIKGDSKIALDPAQEVHRIWNRNLFTRAFRMSDIIFCNQHEAESVMKYLDVHSLSEICKPLVVCTKGSDGSDVYIDGIFHHFDAIRADKIVDVTGAGDAFRAGFYAGLYHRYTTVESVVIACSVSSYIVEKVGALSNIPTWDQVMERADGVMSRMGI